MRPPFIVPFRQWVVTAVIAVLAAGCLTIEENYTFKKDGSGTMEYVVDLSAFADMMKSMEGLSGAKDKDDGMGEMDMKDEAGKLKGVPGISKVKVKEEQDGFVQRITFRFADVDALNRALNVLLPDSSGTTHVFFAWEGNTLVRTNNLHAEEMGGGLVADESDSLDMSGMLKSMQYKYSFTFDNAIGDVGIASSLIREDPSPKQMKLSTDWSAIMADPKALDLRITVNK
jgi:hypothetical protein